MNHNYRTDSYLIDLIMRLKLFSIFTSRCTMYMLLTGVFFWFGCSSPTYIMRNDLLLEQGREDEAIDITKAQIADDPEEPEHHYQLARIYYRTNALDNAKMAVSKAILMEPMVDRYRLLAGKIAYRAKDYFDAINHLVGCLVINNRLLEAHFLLAKSYQQIDNPAKALVQIESALSIEPLYFEAHLLSVSIQFNQIKNQMINQNIDSETAAYENIHNNLNTLVVKLEKALKIKPASLQGNLILSEIYYSMGATYKAKHILEKWLESNPPANEVILAVSRIEYEAGNLEAADKLLTKLESPDLDATLFTYKIKKLLDPKLDLIPEIKKLAIAHPDSATVYLVLGEFELNRGHLPEAEDNIQKSLNLKPDYSDAYFQLSRVYKAQNDILGSRWALKKSFEFAPNNFNLQMQYLNSLIEDGRWDEAAKFVDRYQPDSQNSQVIFYKAVITKEKGNYFLAEQLFKSAQTKRYAPEIELQLADLDIVQGKFASAEKRLARLEALSPVNIDLALAKSNLFYKMKRISEIPPLLEPLKSNANASAQVYLLLAEIYLEQMDLQKAVSVLAEGLERWPRHPELAQAYTMVLGLAGDYNKAIEMMEEMQTYQHKYNQLFYYRLRTYYFQAGEKEKFRVYPRNYKLKK